MLTCVVLGKISLNNVFNQLIVMLCAFDTLYNCFCIVEYSLKKVTHLQYSYCPLTHESGWCQINSQFTPTPSRSHLN